MRPEDRDSGASQASPSLISHHSFSHVVMTSPKAASTRALPESRQATLQVGVGVRGWAVRGHPSPPRARPPLTRPPTNPSRSPADDVLVVDDELEQHTHEAAALRKCGRPPDSRSRPRGRDAVPHFGRRHRGRRAQRLQGGGVIVVYDARRWPHGRPVAGALPVVLELGW